MLALLLAPLYLILNYYVFHHILRWLCACRPVWKSKGFFTAWWVCCAFISFSPLTAFLLPASDFQRFISWLSCFWLGCLLYTSLLILAADGTVRALTLLRRIRRTGWAQDTAELSDQARRSRSCRAEQNAGYRRWSDRRLAAAGLLLSCCILAICIYGVHHAAQIKVTEYSVSIDKPADRTSLRVVLAADLHLGCSVGTGQMERMTELINRQHPDLVCIAGDIFDNSYMALDDPDRLARILSGIQSRCGVYACPGNHDVEERLLAGFTFPHLSERERENIADGREKMERFLTASGIRLLRDETILIDDSFYLIGRRDRSERDGAGPRKSVEVLMNDLRKTQDPAVSLPVIVMDHQPRDLSALAAAGVDLTLSGHTHDGQMFPANLLMPLLWENPCGMLETDGMYSIVTSGVGVWGPNMRILTDSEIVVINITFTGQA